jgi:hypothetical protein
MSGDLGAGIPGMEDSTGIDGLPGGDQNSQMGTEIAPGVPTNPGMAGSPLPPAGTPAASKKSKTSKQTGQRTANAVLPGKILHPRTANHLLNKFATKIPNSPKMMKNVVKSAERIARREDKQRTASPKLSILNGHE